MTTLEEDYSIKITVKETAGPLGKTSVWKGRLVLSLTPELTDFQTGKGLGNPPEQVK